ncbi:HNH endonuclease family protein [Streptomyces olivochromogenes]|uniref:HNH endonuclease family protein n=1 Tax=Streptomyces olivochromogenes TaxID=1963 RepID=UPI0036D8F063
MIFERNPVVRFTPAARTAAAALSAFVVLLAPTTAHAATPTHVAPGDTVAMPVRDALKALPVQDESRAGYERTKFRHWIDADKDSCNTRQEVLKAEAVLAPQQGPGCALTGGEWYSPYDDKYFTDARGLDIDHLVPLAEAWDSGASAWTAKEREAYANDLGDDRALIAVSAASNRSKSDQDPSTWQPPAQGYRCQYATDWVADKTRWGLTIDPTEHAALSEALSNCPDQPITVTLAR